MSRQAADMLEKLPSGYVPHEVVKKDGVHVHNCETVSYTATNITECVMQWYSVNLTNTAKYIPYCTYVYIIIL